MDQVVGCGLECQYRLVCWCNTRNSDANVVYVEMAPEWLQMMLRVWAQKLAAYAL